MGVSLNDGKNGIQNTTLFRSKRAMQCQAPLRGAARGCVRFSPMACRFFPVSAGVGRGVPVALRSHAVGSPHGRPVRARDAGERPPRGWLDVPKRFASYRLPRVPWAFDANPTGPADARSHEAAAASAQLACPSSGLLALIASVEASVQGRPQPPGGLRGCWFWGRAGRAQPQRQGVEQTTP